MLTTSTIWFHYRHSLLGFKRKTTHKEKDLAKEFYRCRNLLLGGAFIVVRLLTAQKSKQKTMIGEKKQNL